MTGFPYVMFGVKGDIPAVKELLKQNLYENVPAHIRYSNGFLRYDVEPEVLERSVNDGNLTIAKVNGKLAGYLWTLTKEQARESPFFSEFMENAAKMEYQGRILTDWRATVYAQVCIGKEFRGSGVLEQLHLGVKNINKARYDLAITEIDSENQVSWNTHSKRFGMKHIGDYNSRSGAYWRVVALDFRENFPFEVAGK